MGKTVDKHRIRNRYGSQLQSIYGDEDGGSSAPLYANMAAELAKGVGSLVADKQNKDAAEKKKKDADAALKELNAAKADMSRADSLEKDKNGPLHKAAQKRLSDASDKVVALSAGSSSSSSSTSDAGKSSKSSHGGEGVPWWVWPLVGVGTLGAVFVTVKLVRGGKKGKR